MSDTALEKAKQSAGTFVPPEFRFTETHYEPTPDVTREDLSELSDNDLLTGLKKQYSNVRQTHGQFGRDLGALVRIYDEVAARFKHERVSVNRNGEPTLQQAFGAIGWNYEAARKMRQRYNAYTRAIPDYARPPKPRQLAEGDLVIEHGKDGAFAVINVYGQTPANSPTVDIVPDGDDDATPRTVTTESLKKLPVRKIKVGDLLMCDDSGTEYKYEGHGRFSRTKTPTLLEKKRERELAAIKAKQEREMAKAEEKKRQIELRKAEAARRDLERIAEKDAKAKKKVNTKAARATKPKANDGTKSAQKSTNTNGSESKRTMIVDGKQVSVTVLPPMHGQADWRTQETLRDEATDAAFAKKGYINENGKNVFVGKSTDTV